MATIAMAITATPTAPSRSDAPLIFEADMASLLAPTSVGQLPRETAPSLRSNFSWTLTGNVVYSACQWGMISTLAKLGDASLVGRFALGLAITAPIFMFTNLQLRGVQATDARSDFDFADYFTLRWITTLAGLVLVGAIALLGRFETTTAWVILLLGISKAIESGSDVIAGLLQKEERLDRVAISLMIRGVCSLVIFAATFRRMHSILVAVASLVLVWLAVFVFYDLRQARQLVDCRPCFFAFRRTRLRRLALLSAPLGIVMTLVSLNVNLPRYLLERTAGPADLGIFASLAYLLVAVSLIVNALGQSVVSRLARLFAEDDRRGFQSILGRLMGFCALILMVGVPMAKFAGRPVLSFVYRPEYGDHVSLFVLMAATAGVSSIASFLGYGMTAARLFRRQVPVIAASTLATAVSSMLLIPHFTSVGAASAILIGSCVMAVCSGTALFLALRPTQRAN